jgi:3-hydroxybutyryl-CoA dehydrogenase
VESKLAGVRVAVAGLGTVGTELALGLLTAGAEVIGIEADADLAAAAWQRLLHAFVASETAAADAFSRFTVGADPAAAAGCAIVIEALPEDLATKRDVLSRLAEVCGQDAVAVVTALALPLAEVVEGTGWAGRACGVRYVGPLSSSRLVELVRLPAAEHAAEVGTDLCAALGKRVHAGPDSRTAVALLFRLLNAAALMYDHGYASAADIDAAMRLGCGWPVGPLAMLDTIGLDCARAVLDTLAERTGRDVFVPAPVLRRLVSAGRLGPKTGVGFHRYPPGAPSSAETGAASAPPRLDEPRIERVGVLGSGTMAVGIAAGLVTAGIPTVLVARSTAKAAAAVAAAMEQADDASAPLVGTDSVADLASCDLVIEAVVEDLAVKRDLLAAVDRVCAPGTVLATTTSSLPVIDCATAVSRQEDVVGLHFFNPVPAMPLVELVTTALTRTRAERLAEALCHRMGKHVVRCADRAGFIVNRLLFPMLNDAVAAVGAGTVGADAVDAVLRSGVGLPMGPIRLLDVVGADVALNVQESLCREFGPAELTPAPALRELVASGHLGRKAERSVRTHPLLRRRPVAS